MELRERAEWVLKNFTWNPRGGNDPFWMRVEQRGPCQVKDTGELDVILDCIDRCPEDFKGWIVEIGTGKGGTAALMAAKAVFHGGLKVITMSPDLKPEIEIELKGLDEVITYYNVKSEPFYEEFRKIVGDDKVWFLYVDGEHTEQGANRDLNLYYPHVAKGGYILCHDMTMERVKRGVESFMNEHPEFKRIITRHSIQGLYKKE